MCAWLATQLAQLTDGRKWLEHVSIVKSSGWRDMGAMCSMLASNTMGRQTCANRQGKAGGLYRQDSDLSSAPGWTPTFGKYPSGSAPPDEPARTPRQTAAGEHGWR